MQAVTALHALVGSSLAVQREELETAAVLSRTASCFVRFGHFEFHAHHGTPQQWAALADHVIDNHFAHYDEVYHREVMRRWRAKLGLREAGVGDADLLNRWLTLLQRGKADFTLAFRNLADAIEVDPPNVLARPFDEQVGMERYAAPQATGQMPEIGCSA